MHNLQPMHSRSLQIKERNNLTRAKPFTLHLSLLLFVLLYAFLGGFVFDRIETKVDQETRAAVRKNRTLCVIQLLSRLTSWSKDAPFRNDTAERIARCFDPERDERTEWSFLTATLYGFGIVTTLGYNRIAPSTYAGRMFCIAYGICGIPFTMVIIANIGQYLNKFAKDSRRKFEMYRAQRRMSKASLAGKEYKEPSIQVTSLALLCGFLIYISMGALLLPALNGEVDFFNGLYYNFLCLTAIDFGQLVPAKVEFLPITFLYVCLGLAITTIAIEIGSEYMKKLHYLGKKMKDAAQTKIWFGGKTLKVRDLLHAVGKKCGIDPGVIDSLDLENVVERTIAIQEGREPPDDTNDEPPREPTISNHSMPPSPPYASSPQEDSPFMDRDPSPTPCPDLIIRNPIYHSLSNEFYAPPIPEKVYNPNVEMCQIAMPSPISDIQEIVAVLESPPRLEDINVQPPASVIKLEIRARSVTPEEKVPKRFREKKEMYGRDPRKLYDTYKEEWDRLERLSGQKQGPRRRSILNLTNHATTPTPDRSLSPGPYDHHHPDNDSVQSGCSNI